MSDEHPNEEKKIIIDEDWKSQVEAEQEAARQQPETPAPETPAPEPAESAAKATGPLPPPNLGVLASGLYLQGMVSLGLLPSPSSDKPEMHLDQAKHAVDMLQVLYEKTEGNRTADETSEMDAMLHELRLAFVSVQETSKAQ